MPSLNMEGPFYLNAEKIDEIITKTSAGNYALGDKNDDKFTVSYVGRADSDLNDRLNDHATKKQYRFFKYSYASSPKAAFLKECENYHDFGGDDKLDNKIHPDRPSNSKDWKCPKCSRFD